VAARSRSLPPADRRARASEIRRQPDENPENGGLSRMILNQAIKPDLSGEEA
jgi:hypothetical protein